MSLHLLAYRRGPEPVGELAMTAGQVQAIVSLNRG